MVLHMNQNYVSGKIKQKENKNKQKKAEKENNKKNPWMTFLYDSWICI